MKLTSAYRCDESGEAATSVAPVASPRPCPVLPCAVPAAAVLLPLVAAGHAWARVS
jgi:hypothetical protein